MKNMDIWKIRVIFDLTDLATLWDLSRKKKMNQMGLDQQKQGIALATNWDATSKLVTLNIW